MEAKKANVLVVDDDEVVLVAVADLLEEAGLHVVTQQSPIGATQVIVRERIDLAVIDVNLPVMQGDNVVRLLQTWDRVKEIPIVIISGAPPDKIAALQADLPQTRFVPKAAMNTLLVPVIEDLLQRRARKSRATAATTTFDGKSTDLISRFTDQVSAELGSATARWREIAAGSDQHKLALSSAISTLRGQAQLLGLEKPAQLLGALSVVVEAARPGDPVPATVDSAVESSIAALLTLERSPTADFAMSPEPLQKRLMQALSLLRVTQG
jgi:CheY-like chemotaxis protein